MSAQIWQAIAFSQHTTPIEVRMQWSQGAGHIRALHEIKDLRPGCFFDFPFDSFFFTFLFYWLSMIYRHINA
jgi:hypothetical protein